MLTLNVRNVNEALPAMITRFRMDQSHVTARSPRGIKTIEWDAPVCTTYRNPMERVLFDPTRDANPFFHLFESMWILAGRRDVKFLAQFLPRISDFSDDGEIFRAAYGYRLRCHWGYDQLKLAATLLQRDPETRRAVCCIWDPQVDLQEGKDIPCNDLLAFRMRSGALDLTVYNRSNDVIWGAYGANAVQFAFILEHVAALVGVRPGQYHQISNSFHIYLNDQWDKLKELNIAELSDPYDGIYQEPQTNWMPMGDPILVMADLNLFFGRWDRGDRPDRYQDYVTHWMRDVLIPAWQVFFMYKHAKERKDMKLIQGLADSAVVGVDAPDWALAISQWIQRRAS